MSSRKVELFTGSDQNPQFKHKAEVKPLFNPVTNKVDSVTGTPVFTDFYESRYIPSDKRQGEKPFYEERIAAPIAGTVNNPLSSNFNPSIDQLRTANKQQVSYEGRTKAGQLGSVRAPVTPVTKNRPDTHYNLGPERLFT